MTTDVAATTAARRPVVAHVLHGVVALCAGVGVGVEISRAVGADGSVLANLVHLFSYFTIWTNTLVCAVSAVLAVRPRADGPVFRALRLDSVQFVVVTGVTYHLLLSGYTAPDAAGRFANLVTHTIVPVALVVVWLLVGPRRRVRPVTMATALVLPALWTVWTFVRGHVTGWYPYPFLDASELGFARALVGSLTILALGAALGPVAWLLDRVLPPAPR